MEDPRGVVEVFMNGEWGPVCFEGASIEEADVVCKQLAYTTAVDHFVDQYVET